MSDAINKKLPISLVIICHNSGDKVAKVINHHKDYVNEVIVVDQGSTDDTYEVLKPLVDIILKKRCKGYSDPDRQWAFSLGSQPFVLALDDDEFLPQATLDALPSILASGVDAIWLKRNNIVDGISIVEAFGDDIQCRLFRKGSVRWPDEMHHFPDPAKGLKVLYADYWMDHERTFEGLKKANNSRRDVATPQMQDLQDLFIKNVEKFLASKRGTNVG